MTPPLLPPSQALKRIWRKIEMYVDKRHKLDGAKLVTMFQECTWFKGCVGGCGGVSGLRRVVGIVPDAPLRSAF